MRDAGGAEHRGVVGDAVADFAEHRLHVEVLRVAVDDAALVLPAAADGKTLRQRVLDAGHRAVRVAAMDQRAADLDLVAVERDVLEVVLAEQLRPR